MRSPSAAADAAAEDGEAMAEEEEEIRGENGGDTAADSSERFESERL
jgi:hypothetical protein